jgi:uncharacterized hydrophobic protein (TIGR00271 family)
MATDRKQRRSELGRMLRGFFNFRQGRASYKVIERRIEDGARIDGIHLCQLVAAMLIASIGLNLDSVEAIIGAMLICPLMGSVLAISHSIATGDRRALREALVGLFAQMAVCLVTSTLYFALSPVSHRTSELLINSTPTIWDLLIALIGGFAGALGYSRREEPSTLIAGVAVATALMPPLCATGYGIAMHELTLALMALYEFGLNVIFIAFGAEIVLVLLGVPTECDLNGDGVVTDEERAMAASRGRQLRDRLVVGSLLFAIPCLFVSASVVRQTLAENGSVFEVHDLYETELTTLELSVVAPQVEGYRIGTETSYNRDTQQLEEHIVATVVSREELSDARKKQIQELIKLHVPDLEQVTFELPKDTQVVTPSTPEAPATQAATAVPSTPVTQAATAAPETPATQATTAAPAAA